MLREHFLERLWIPYPSAHFVKSQATDPIEEWICGRFETIEDSQLVLNKNFIRERFDLSSDCRAIGLRAPLSLDEFRTMLRVDDWIAVGIFHRQVVVLGLVSPSAKVPSIPPRLDLVTKWIQFRTTTMEHFRELGFHEIETPTLVPCPGTEIHLDPFATVFQLGQQKRARFLPTSPELHLKRALCMGFDKIFEVRSCFRNGELSPSHQPEFTMLEWYRSFAELSDIQSDISHLLRCFTNDPVDVEKLSVAESFRKVCGFELSPDTPYQVLWDNAQKAGLRPAPTDSWDDLFNRFIVDRIEPSFAFERLTFLYDYPPAQAALAKINERGWAERFECYWRGLELANAYNELNDPVVQRERMRGDLEARKVNGGKMIPLDEAFLECLESGMPPSVGVALGLERLFMAIHGVTDLRDLRLFPELG